MESLFTKSHHNNRNFILKDVLWHFLQWWLLFKSFQTKLVNIPKHPADMAADTHYRCDVRREGNSLYLEFKCWHAGYSPLQFVSVYEHDLGTWFPPHGGTEEVHAWCLNSAFPLLFCSTLHVSRFGSDSILHILCSSISARAAERGDDIWHWWSYAVLTTNTLLLQIYPINCRAFTNLHISVLLKCFFFLFLCWTIPFCLSVSKSLDLLLILK